MLFVTVVVQIDAEEDWVVMGMVSVIVVRMVETLVWTLWVVTCTC